MKIVLSNCIFTWYTHININANRLKTRLRILSIYEERGLIMEENKRGSFGSTMGFLMAAVGSAVGLGNIWGFPYKMGKNGGFAFLLIYLVLVIFVGFVVMVGELTIGRKTGLGAVGAYKKLSKRFSWVGWLGVISAFLILCFYCVLGGMVLRYMVGYVIAIFGGDGWAGADTGFFSFLLYDFRGMIIFFAIFLVLNCLIVMGGVKGGIEKFSTIAMPALFVILVAIVIYVACQDGAGAGYAFMFKPDFTFFESTKSFFDVFKTAAGQMFFSLSLGMSAMITYGSYLPKNEHIQKNAVIICISDTLVALLAGMAVMPACAAFGVDYGAGPGLLFHSMQTVFANMGSIGNFIGFLFYLLVFIAAITSSISLLEGVSSTAIDKRILKGKSPRRKTITIIFAVIIFIVGLPVALDALGSGSAAVKNPAELFGFVGDAVRGWNDCWLDFYDMISEGLLMPLGALVMSLLIGWYLKTKSVKEECELSGAKFKGYLFFDICFKIVVPIIMAVVLFAQIESFFIG